MLKKVIFLNPMDQLYCAMLPSPFAPQSTQWNDTNILPEINLKLQKSLPFLRWHMRVFPKNFIFDQIRKKLIYFKQVNGRWLRTHEKTPDGMKEIKYKVTD